jgi:DNA primase
MVAAITAEFVRAVRELAERAGVDASRLDRPQPRDRRADLLREFFDLCRRELRGERGARARAYLERRGFPSDAIADFGLGVVPPSAETSRKLEQAGFRPSEIAAAGVLADSRWPGRLCGAWRDSNGRIATFWARALDDGSDSRYLYLRGASRTDLPPYGFSDLLARGADLRTEMVLVEGFLDVHQLRARGVENVAALGGTSIRPRTFEQLHRFGIDTVTLCLDNDEAGRAAAARAIENAVRAREAPDVQVIDPRQLAPAKDPDELVRQRGAEAWKDVVASRTCGITWRARELAKVSRDASALERRISLRRAAQWLGTLPPRLSLEQEDAIRAVALECGYSPEAAEPAFRARFFRDRRSDRVRVREHALER